MGEIPQKYDYQKAEEHWMKQWETWKIHRWDDTKSRKETFVVDTPPPTVSGSLHIGHVFSYTHQDLNVRYRRMQGKNIFYPMGWDDNGLPTERRVQNLLRIRCNPSLPYQPDWRPNRNKHARDPVEEVSRKNFIEACGLITHEDESTFEELWRHLGLSLDWTQQYATINEHSRNISQRSFLDLIQKEQVYQIKAPTMWDIDFQTAVAQADLEDREIGGYFHDIRFGLEDGTEFMISTTRPELLPACIAVVAHPDDVRYQKYFGKKAITPLFHTEVPILAAKHADPEKGTGILMVCTFGDSMDVEWWKQSGLPIRQVIGLDGRILPVDFTKAPFSSRNPEKANQAYQSLAGLHSKQARKKIAELLTETGSSVDGKNSALVGEVRPIQHAVKFYEKGERPLEFVPTRQWFIRILDHKAPLLEQGKKIQWHPAHMYHRYESWVEGLNQDWCISRQRYFGVPFPVWYPISENGVIDYDKPIYATVEQLPVDPLSDVAPGYREEQRGKPGGFAGDPDVMDTWATSSLTPQISSHWAVEPHRHQKLFPMDIRPQAHEIIRTWAFYTIVKAWMHEDEIPWYHVVISGWVLDPERTGKISKSKEGDKNKKAPPTPRELISEFSSDGVRYWTARARLGTDTVFDHEVLKVGLRLATKIFNASRFALLRIEELLGKSALPSIQAIQVPLDVAFVQKLCEVVQYATDCFEQFDYASALQRIEELFWMFCDNYLELVKARSYATEDSPARQSATATLGVALKTFLRLFAPYMPYVTEEVWGWRFAEEFGIPSIHKAPWPSSQEFEGLPSLVSAEVFPLAVTVLEKIRGAKTKAQKSLKWPVSQIEITGTAQTKQWFENVQQDVFNAGRILENALKWIETTSAENEWVQVNVTLSDTESS